MQDTCKCCTDGNTVCYNKIYNGKYYIHKIVIDQKKSVICVLVPAKDVKHNYLEGIVTINDENGVVIIPDGELKEFLIKEDCIGDYFNVEIDNEGKFSEGKREEDSCCASSPNCTLYYEEHFMKRMCYDKLPRKDI